MSAFQVSTKTCDAHSWNKFVNITFKESFCPPDLVGMDFPISLYAGSAVLNTFYGGELFKPSDFDLFVPVCRDDESDTYLRELKTSVRGCLMSFPDGRYPTGSFHPVNIKNDKVCLNVIFVSLHESEFDTIEHFHKALVELFDIKICSLAWDGEQLYYPPKSLVDLDNMSSIVMKLPSPVDEVSRANKKERILKYMLRGFTMIDEDTRLQYTFRLGLNGEELL